MTQLAPAAEVAVLPFVTLGAEVRGIQVADGVSPEQYQAVKRALDAHGVVVLKEQEISPAAQREFAASIGTLRPLVYSRYSLPGSPEVMVVSNIRKDGEYIGISDAGSLWHSDGAYLSHPDMYSLLYGVQIPRAGGVALGDTKFADMAGAYAALPEQMKRRLDGLYAINSFEWHLDKKAKQGTLRRAPLTPEQKAATPDVRHPVVRRHPNTGRPCLFVNDAHTREIEGLTPAQSDALIEELLAHLQHPRFQYAHSWSEGDLVVWDNSAVQHLATFDYGETPRLMHRTGTYGPAPVAYSMGARA